MGRLHGPPDFESVLPAIITVIEALMERGAIADDDVKSILPCVAEALLLEDATLWPHAERAYLERRREALVDEIARLESVAVAQYWSGCRCEWGPGRAEQGQLDYMAAIEADVMDIDARLAVIPMQPPSHARIRAGLCLVVIEALARRAMPNEHPDRVARTVNAIARAVFGIGARAASKMRTDLKGRLRNDRGLLAGFRARWPWIEAALLPARFGRCGGMHLSHWRRCGDCGD